MPFIHADKPFRLSICIPTFNRSACLRELLESIEAQQRPDVEVVIGNDASPDDTAKVMAEFAGRIQNLSAKTHPLNLGLDLNYQAVAEAAGGEYIWMMGDDDRVEPGGVDKVIQHLDRWPGVVGLTLGVLDYDSRLQNPTGLRDMPPEQVVHGAAELFTLIPQHLGFMSALVIRRDSWMHVLTNDPVQQFQNLYSQVYVIGRAVGDAGAWGVSPVICVAFRSDNDQFQRRMGWYGRLEADVLAYAAVSDAVLSGHPQAHHAMTSKILGSHVLARLRNGKLVGLKWHELWKAVALLLRHYAGYRQCWTGAIPTLMTPAPFLRVGKWLYQRLHPSSGHAKARAAASAHGLN